MNEHRPPRNSITCRSADIVIYTYTYSVDVMVTKTLTITEEAYESLKANKRADESFTETVLRLTGGERDIWKGHGALSNADGFRERVESTHEALDEDFDRRQDDLYGQ